MIFYKQTYNSEIPLFQEYLHNPILPSITINVLLLIEKAEQQPLHTGKLYNSKKKKKKKSIHRFVKVFSVKKRKMLLTISPKSTTFSPRTMKIPRGMSPYFLPTWIRSIVRCRARFAEKKQIYLFISPN